VNASGVVVVVAVLVVVLGCLMVGHHYMAQVTDRLFDALDERDDRVVQLYAELDNVRREAGEALAWAHYYRAVASQTVVPDVLTRTADTTLVLPAVVDAPVLRPAVPDDPGPLLTAAGVS
jgi:hypothetical protein